LVSGSLSRRGGDLGGVLKGVPDTIEKINK